MYQASPVFYYQIYWSEDGDLPLICHSYNQTNTHKWFRKHLHVCRISICMFVDKDISRRLLVYDIQHQMAQSYSYASYASYLALILFQVLVYPTSWCYSTTHEWWGEYALNFCSGIRGDLKKEVKLTLGYWIAIRQV